MKIINKLLLTGLICMLIGLPSVYADEQKSSGMHEGKGKGEHMFAQLNLTDEQKTQLKANKDAQRAQMKASFEQMKTQREALRQELMKPQLDMNKVNAIQTQLKAGMSQMADNRLNSILQVRKILTPEQFNKFLTKMQEHHRGFEHKMGKGHSSDEKSE